MAIHTKNKKINKHKTQLLNEVDLFIGAQSQKLYSYAAWLCNDKPTAEKATEQVLDQVLEKIDSETNIKQINNEFFKTLKSYCKQKKLELDTHGINNKEPDYDQDKLSISIRNVLRKVPERYSEPLVTQILSDLPVIELAKLYEVSEPEISMRLSAARKIVSALVELELSLPQSNETPEMKITKDKYANGLLASMST